jgi:uncharacterized Zn finger protein
MTSATDNRTTELLPCKKCGGEAEIVSAKLVNEAFSDASCVARCRSCGNRTDRWYSDEDAAESWNRRNGGE